MPRMPFTKSKTWWGAITAICCSVTIASYAATNILDQQDPYRYGFEVAVAIIFALVGGYCKAIERRVTNLEKSHDTANGALAKTREQLIGDYTTKAETHVHRDKVEKSLSTIHGRLDDLFALLGSRKTDVAKQGYRE